MDSDTSSKDSSSTETASKDTKGSGDYKVGITFSDLSNPVWAELVKEAEAYTSSTIVITIALTLQ